MRWAFLLTTVVLAGCAANRGAVAAPPVPEPHPVSRQQAVADFALAVGRVIPVAKERCRSSEFGENCDFQVVVDDRPGRAPNAFQSLDASGRPRLTLTSTMIETARNPDEIALIVAHEAAHHIAGHLGRLNAQVTQAIAQRDAAIDTIGAAPGRRLHDAEWPQVQALQREFELAADALGAQIVIAAGFDARRAANILHRLPQPGVSRSGPYPTRNERLRAVGSAREPALSARGTAGDVEGAS